MLMGTVGFMGSSPRVRMPVARFPLFTRLPSCSYSYAGRRHNVKNGKHRTARYISVRQLIGTRTSRYRAVPLKWAVGNRLREKSTVGSRLKKKKGRRRGKEERKIRGEEVPRAVLAWAPSSPAGDVSPRWERDRGDASNLRQHIKAVHQKLQPFACRYSGCRKKFPYRGDFIETDEHLRSRPRGGRKRKCVSVETLKGEEGR
ncbi:hypothetical protein BHE74_00029741 [Ensete ventricosum]|nr:hypothetical protein GW17_00009799 [Ensete ventricosum]RWW63102.1 hypothetical protein BHE74_00029741 [Ensete ventricosum]RZR84048.1 hypothetical protein BHM03_00010787 [Ensete ventricosum]